MADDGFFGAEVAARYDADSAAEFAPEVLGPAVDRLQELAQDGPVLELAIGTGRVALPLAARGVTVRGIERSTAMVRELRAKPGGDALDVTVGDMSTTRVAGGCSLVFLVFNTIGNLTTQDTQVACFANAAAHLRPGGRFVIESTVPDVTALAAGKRHVVFAADPDRHWGIDELDLATQAMWSHHLQRRDDGSWRAASVPLRYTWPAELDLMARLAGLELEQRWGDWDRRPFTAASPKHVSVWRRP